MIDIIPEIKTLTTTESLNRLGLILPVEKASKQSNKEKILNLTL